MIHVCRYSLKFRFVSIILVYNLQTECFSASTVQSSWFLGVTGCHHRDTPTQLHPLSAHHRHMSSVQSSWFLGVTGCLHRHTPTQLHPLSAHHRDMFSVQSSWSLCVTGCLHRHMSSVQSSWFLGVTGCHHRHMSSVHSGSSHHCGFSLHQLSPPCLDFSVCD